MSKDYVNEHLQKHMKVSFTSSSGQDYYEHAPRFKCADGYEVSIQARDGNYCTPRQNNACPYSAVELGFPNAHDPLLDEWCESPEKPTDTVYGYVPVEVVNALIEKHGGPFIATPPNAEQQ